MLYPFQVLYNREYLYVLALILYIVIVTSTLLASRPRGTHKQASLAKSTFLDLPTSIPCGTSNLKTL
jgi:hypothetical protein